MDNEVVVKLADGCTIRSDSKEYQAGDYVSVCDPEGKEVGYWHWEEWQDDPIHVMGAILQCAAGVRKE